MKANKAKVTRGLQTGSLVPTCDNSAANILKIVSIKKIKNTTTRVPS